MKKITGVSDVAIEITRRCNMNCAHCMRGEPENCDISEEVIDRFLQGIHSIGTLVLTGGEISLNISGIKHITKRIREWKIPVSSAYLVTNGKQVTDEFMLAIMDLYLATEMDELSCLAVSRDQFHEPIPPNNLQKLSLIRFFDKGAHNWDFTKSPLINLGRARNITDSQYEKREPRYEELSGEIDGENQCWVNSTMVCTVHGDILSDCDYEYANVAPIFITNVMREDWVDDIAALLDEE